MTRNAIVPYINAFKKGIAIVATLFVGSNQNGQVIYTHHQYTVVQIDSFAEKSTKLKIPHAIGTENPIADHRKIKLRNILIDLSNSVKTVCRHPPERPVEKRETREYYPDQCFVLQHRKELDCIVEALEFVLKIEMDPS